MGDNPFLKFWDLGYARLLPVVPSSAGIRAAGKRPGLLGGAGWYGTSVTLYDATIEDLDRWAAMGADVGIRCDRDIVGLDIDTLAGKYADQIMALALKMLGPSKPRYGRRPKGLLPYRVSSPVAYRQARFDDGLDEKKPGLVELLAGPTKWFKAHGLHPDTGRAYEWPESIPPYNELTVVTPAQLDAFFAALAELLPKWKGSSGSASVDRTIVDQDALRGEPTLVRQAIEALPNERKNFGYEEWVRIAAALRAALPEDENLALDLFVDWSDKAKLTETTEDPERVFRSLHAPFGVGAQFLYGLAAKHSGGQFDAAAQWFEPYREPVRGPEALFPEDDGGEGEDEPRPKIQATLYRFPAPSAIPKRQTLYAGHYTRKYVSSTVAPSKVGKSALIIAEALVMASGKPLLGITPKGTSRVWIWNGEDPMDELEGRIAAAMMHYGLTPEDIGNRLLVNSGRDMEIVIASETKDGAKIAAPVVQEVQATLLENAIDVAMIDPFVSSHRVSENDNGAIDMVAKQWAKIADRTRSAIELVHHVRKLNGGEVTVEDGRGAVALLAAVRSARALARMTKVESARFGLDDVARRRLFRFADVSSNLALPGNELASWLRLESVALGNWEDGEQDEMGVVTEWKPGVAAEGEIDLKADVLEAIRGGKWRRSAASPNEWIGIPIARALGLDREDAMDKARIKTMVSAWCKDGTLREVMRKNEHHQERPYLEIAGDEPAGGAFG